MRVLIADDDAVMRHALARQLTKWSLPPVVYANGLDVRESLARDGIPDIMLIDWNMPGVDGLTLCREVRGAVNGEHPYIILVTSNREKCDVVAGLSSGADDYVVKPFDWGELRARIAIGQRTTALQHLLAQRVEELEAAAVRVRQLAGLLPMCSYCKAIRTDTDYWQQLETYLHEHSEATFTHGICPPCFENVRRSYGCDHVE